MQSKHLYFRLGLINLAFVALLGFTMRLKILFEIPFLDYRNLLNAHSHFAFCGWVGFMLLALSVHYLLSPEARSRFRFLLLAVDATAIGMLLTFPWLGYAGASLVFSSAYVVLTFVFAGMFLARLSKASDGNARMLMICALVALIISAAGPIVLGWMKAVHSTNAILHRSALYWYLHFQYNGFFTLTVFAHYIARRPAAAGSTGARKGFTVALSLATLPTLFLSLLWNNNPYYYGIAAAGVVLLIVALYFFVRLWLSPGSLASYRSALARRLMRLSFGSFILKTLMQIGTLVPSLGHAVFADRPVIIGFLHLVFLGFVSFYLLAQLAEAGYFARHRGSPIPAYLFAAGVLANEGLLLLQGLGILLGTNSRLFEWGLLGAAALLLTGASAMAVTAVRARSYIREEAAV
ncbi:MAG: hypothetical protein EOO08_01285 [Chitinophagaceae bacterium]|nr:MAG: hypothetical protein EOO08_01285 [Chitinophagaceae bacterium]